MNDDTQTPDTSSDAPRDEKLAELIKEVDEDPGTEGASEMSDRHTACLRPLFGSRGS